MTAYGQAALDAEVAAVRSTGSGGRNGQLNKSAFAIAQLVAGDQLDAEPARAALRDAANETGLERREVETALASGWKAGLAIPRYPYRDEGGRVIYAKARVDKPDRKYEYQRPDGAGGWASGRGDIEAVPYRLPELIAAPKDAVIYMAEGEKHADKLASWGLVATSHKDWKGFEFSGYVRGRTVVILPDNDEEGEACAERAAAKVVRAEGRPVIVRLPRLLAKGDIMDWDGDAAELATLVDAALNPPPETLALADLTLWSRVAATPTPFFVPGLIPAREVTLLTGAGGGNKSTFGQQLATCAAAGRQLLGLDVTHAGALYITAEDSDDRLHWMQEHLCRALGVDMASLAGKLHLASIRGRLNNELATFDHEGRLTVRDTYHLVHATLVATGAKLLVLDNVAHLFAGNENDRGQVTAFVNLLYAMARDLGVTVLLIAHRNKAGDAYSGSTAWLNAVRSQLLIERPEEGYDPDARVLTVGKANYARPDQQLAFRWHDFALVRDEDLPAVVREEITAIARDHGDDGAFLACLAERTRIEQAVSEKVSSTFAPKVFADMPESRRIGQRRLEMAMDRLLRRGEIERALLPWKRDRKDVFGLRLTCADRCADAAQTGCADVPDHTAPTVRNTHPPYYVREGAGPDGPPAPSSSWQANPALGRSRVVFPEEPGGMSETVWGEGQ